ncbi:YggS family pyridoxal phosphate-dependent enzyme [Rosettibacter firmus]|uniref:YggS family pyridoxal phosphate-dependent enzyme n=1 Tax=Rosettibacter firmus TaxID=3111522 RepID=UPI00336C2120
MIVDNLKRLEEQISKKCELAGRRRTEITLIAVTKTQPIEIIKQVIDTGLKDLGENKAQELRDKAEILHDNVNWHFIGHLQTNKVKYVIKSAKVIHSVDSIKLAEEINKKALQIGKKQDILLEIKTSNEATKHGLSDEEEIFKLAEYCKDSSNLNLIGLMTMAPFTDDAELIRKSFVQLRKLKEKMNNSGFNLTELSMGMTNDFEIAIEEGSTMLRIGTAIFGQRKNN